MIENPFSRVQEGAAPLEEGCFLLERWRSGRVAVPIRIWFGPPNDPITGDPLDRSWRWSVEINGHDANDPSVPARIGSREVHDLIGIWPEAKRCPIPREEYDYLVARAVHAEEHDPRDPYGTESGRIDPMTATLPFF